MLAELLKALTPEMLVHAIKTNQVPIMMALQKFDAYNSFGAALSVEQQMCISSNLPKINDFFLSKDGKDALSILAEGFMTFCSK